MTSKERINKLNTKIMKITLNNKEIELTQEEVNEIVKQSQEKKEEKVIGIAITNRFTGEVIFQSTKTTYKEAIIEKGDANLRGANLTDANLSYANLSYANLSYANLYGANLRDADLRDANLYGANLTDANLTDANLSGADLYGANLRDANLTDADLSGADLQNAKFHGRGGTVVIKKANLEGFLGALGFKLEE